MTTALLDTEPAADSALARGIDAAIDRALAEKRIVGTVVLAARDGRLVYRRAAGLADREAGRPAREDTVFLYASLTKPMVTAAALRLVEEGRIALTDPVTRFLPDFRPKLADGSEPVITIHHLLTHTAGLIYGFTEPADGPYHRAGVSDGLDAPGRSFADNLRRIASVPLAAAPGSAWAYSVALDVLGAALERAAGESLGEIVRRRVAAPLGLTDTGFAPPDRSRLAAAYADAAPEPVRMGETYAIPASEDFAGLSYAPGRIFDPASYPSGGAGMAGTAPDFLRFLEALRRGGAPILKAETVQAMASSQIAGLAMPQSPGTTFGYGFALVTDPAAAGVPMTAGTWRWGGVYGHSWFVDPAKRLSVVGLTNTAIEGMKGTFVTDLRAAIYDGLE
ncbi:serine hydrolase domain-containing protein [Inquilinus limosus]|uniref:Serine hydrolase n=1 Tax=Inquilinus limosus TaxID=171674 RepID=A0A211ZFS6_9PROT|nr:serine hydrolase domain-containing protein [Inquilinus limosus]OWJ64103.1 serine hydrolase [Inquilinus limosus]